MPEYKSEYYKINKDHIKELNAKNYQENKQRLNEKHKEYVQNNKEAINKRLREKIICENCGVESTKGGISTHRKTYKCINFKNISNNI